MTCWIWGFGKLMWIQPDPDLHCIGVNSAASTLPPSIISIYRGLLYSIRILVGIYIIESLVRVIQKISRMNS